MLDVDAAVAVAVDEASSRDSFPLVVAGNCNVTLGVQAGLQRAGDGDAALVWLDAHGDFNTPATTETGYLDGMPLAMLCGRAHREAVERELGGRAARRGDASSTRAAATSTARSSIPCSRPPSSSWTATSCASGDRRRPSPRRSTRSPRNAATSTALEPHDAPQAHLHVDLDVLDPTAAPGVTFPSPRGLSAAQLLEVIDLVRERFTLVAVTVTSFTPDRDEAGTTLAAGLAVLQRVTTELARRP